MLGGFRASANLFSHRSRIVLEGWVEACLAPSPHPDGQFAGGRLRFLYVHWPQGATVMRIGALSVAVKAALGTPRTEFDPVKAESHKEGRFL